MMKYLEDETYSTYTDCLKIMPIRLSKNNFNIMNSGHHTKSEAIN